MKDITMPCPRCGKKYPVGRWCECGYQGNILDKTFEGYLSSMTMSELRELCRIHKAKVARWEFQTKGTLINAMSQDDKLRIALGYKKVEESDDPDD